MLLAPDRLARAKARPLLVEWAIRRALREAIAWRIGGGTTPRDEAFCAAAVAAARQALDARPADRSELARTLHIVQSSAQAFTHSKLWRRLLTISAARLINSRPTSDGADALVRDRRGRLHAIALRSSSDAFAAGHTAQCIAQLTTLPLPDRLNPLAVHVFCLTTQRRHSFEISDLGRRRNAPAGSTAA